jgi:hypothetical protein
MKVLNFDEVLALVDDEKTREKLENLHAGGFLNGDVYRGPGTKEDVMKRITLYLEDL